MVSSRKNRAAKIVLFVLFNIVIITAALEIVLRIPRIEQQYLYQKSWNPRVVLHPDPMLEHIFKPSSQFRSTEIYSEVYNAYGRALLGDEYIFETNSTGLREKELAPRKENEIVVLFLGDSLVAGSQVSKENIMSVHAERVLNAAAGKHHAGLTFRTVNGGIDGYNLVNSLENYRRISAELTPDIIVLGVFINDIMPYAKYFSDNMKVKHFLLEHFYSLRMLKVLGNYIKLYRTEKYSIDQDENVAPQYERVLDRSKLSLLYPKYFPETEFLTKETLFSNTYPQRTLGWLEDRIIDDELLARLPVSPRPVSDYESTASVIRLIHAEAAKSKIPLLVCLIPAPTAYDDNELHFVMEYYDIPEEAIDRYRPQRMMKEAIRKQVDDPGFKVIDLTAPLAEASQNKRAAIPMDCHFGEEGHRIVGKVIAEEIWKLTQPAVRLDSLERHLQPSARRSVIE